MDLVAGDSGEKGGKKRLSVERIYQRKTQLEHILIRPDTYIGSVEETTESMYVFDDEKKAILKRQVTFVPGLYKIFDEILGESSPILWYILCLSMSVLFEYLLITLCLWLQ